MPLPKTLALFIMGTNLTVCIIALIVCIWCYFAGRKINALNAQTRANIAILKKEQDHD
jgi:hypothetical protein